MRCIHMNIRQAVFVLLTFLANNIQSADNTIKLTANNVRKNATSTIDIKELDILNIPVENCPLNFACKDLPVECLHCPLNDTCEYGELLHADCHVKSTTKCHGRRDFPKKYICRYCYQTERWEHNCDLRATCDSVSSPRDIYTSNCTVHDNILCLGHRTFYKKIVCNWTKGKRWWTTLALSITLGGFGADRFYLGHWQEGIGKLFSFGGLGVWTIVDVVLISLHYLGPADGSLYL
ncbi:TM2 domain-containing protein almondex [Dendroctonus ponderosae]|uniref:TM2 domain-containing protein n=1 Tax=Dendroctonus ponderosae TaxID=77166 RepID=J3JUM2_DENPD